MTNTNTPLSDMSRSLPIRQIIILTQKRLRTYFIDLKNMDLSLSNTNINTNAQNQNRLTDIKYGVECLIKKFKKLLKY